MKMAMFEDFDGENAVLKLSAFFFLDMNHHEATLKMEIELVYFCKHGPRL